MLLQYGNFYTDLSALRFTLSYRLKATAGLRMLEESKSTAVLASVSNFLSNKEKSPFLFKPLWAKIISGCDYIVSYYQQYLTLT